MMKYWSFRLKTEALNPIRGLVSRLETVNFGPLIASTVGGSTSGLGALH